MVTRRLLMLSLLFMVVAPARSFADQWYDMLHGVCVPDCIRQRCCDDYCPKPAPATRCQHGYSCNDYCAKPLPCARYTRCFLCDDYCPKSHPCRFCPRP